MARVYDASQLVFLWRGFLTIDGSYLNAGQNLPFPFISQDMGNPSQCMLYPWDAYEADRLQE